MHFNMEKILNIDILIVKMRKKNFLYLMKKSALVY